MTWLGLKIVNLWLRLRLWWATTPCRKCEERTSDIYQFGFCHDCSVAFEEEWEREEHERLVKKEMQLLEAKGEALRRFEARSYR